MATTPFGEPEPRDERHPAREYDPRTDPSLSISDPFPHPGPLRLTEPVGDAHRRRVVDLGVGDAFRRGDLVRVTVVDADGHPVARGLATVDVGPDPADRLTVRFVDLVLPGRQLLPVRPERLPFTDRPVVSLTHAHRHFHPGEPGLHVHTHTHAGVGSTSAWYFGHDGDPHDDHGPRDHDPYGERGGLPDPAWRVGGG